MHIPIKFVEADGGFFPSFDMLLADIASMYMTVTLEWAVTARFRILRMYDYVDVFSR